MQGKLLFRLFGILLCSVCVVKGVSYADQVRDIFKRHFNSVTNKCWKDAISKANESTSDKDKRMAIALINVYTQNCENNYHNNHPFYQELNEKLRNNTTEPIWRATEQLLNTALVLLGRKSWPLLYRSCHCTDIKQKHTITNGGFLSTSLESSRAARFLEKDKVLFLIENSPPGTNITKYSAFDEKEVLLASNSSLYVKEYISDQMKIGAKIAELRLPRNVTMKAFAVVTGDIPNRHRRAAFKQGNCECFRDTTSGASKTASYFSAVVFISFRLVCY